MGGSSFLGIVDAFSGGLAHPTSPERREVDLKRVLADCLDRLEDCEVTRID